MQETETLSPAERLALEMNLSHHHDEGAAVMLIDPVFRHMLRDGGPYTKDGQEFSDKLLEALESWLPKNLQVVDVPDQCHWTQDEDGIWQTPCKNYFVFTEEGPKENHFVFCPYCGGALIHE